MNTVSCDLSASTSIPHKATILPFITCMTCDGGIEARRIEIVKEEKDVL